MYVWVRRAFAIDSLEFEVGDVVLVLPEIAARLPDLLREGVVIVVKAPDDPIRLSKPESGLQLTLR